MSTAETSSRARNRANDAAKTHASNESKEERSGPDALALIKEDHEKVAALFKQALASDATSMKKQRGTIAQIVRELESHAKMEETIFYPALRSRTKAKDDDRQTVLEAIEEHGTMKDLIKKIKRSTGRDETLRAKVQVLSEIVEHHVREEESEMFDQARRLLGDERLRKLGTEIVEFKARTRAARNAAGGMKTTPTATAPSERL